jgi:hypothetical protein
LVRGVNTVQDYLHELRETRKGKPNQVRDALDIYADLWKKVLEKGIVKSTDDIDEALSKLDSVGGLYKAAEE